MKRSIVRMLMVVLLLAVTVTLSLSPVAAYNGGRTYTLDADFDEGTLVGVEHETVHDQLQLSAEHVTLPFIWVPNNTGTVSKVHTETGDELGRYKSLPFQFCKRRIGEIHYFFVQSHS